MTAANTRTIETGRQTVVGVGLAIALMTTWVLIHVYGVYIHAWTAWSAVVAPPLILLQTWLSVGLFIVAHDAMHGSLAPGRPAVNTAFGTLALGLYAGFRFKRLRAAHHRHHAAPGTADDPDFHPDAPRSFLPWFARFFRTYFGWRELVVLTLAVGVAVLLLHARMTNLLAFWALPALLSALQLFVFGTWLPHRVTDHAFDDQHNARSSGYGSLVSLATCFHFGRHLEHHLQPGVPWWGLDKLASERRSAATPTPTDRR
jgi:beta-carotene/zeaxanthin 4-ketolase